MMQGRGAAVLAGICMAIGLAGCSKETQPVAATPSVLVQRVTGGESAVRSYSGEIRARYESDLGFRIPGKIVARLVDVGTTVKTGQALARIDGADAGLQAAQADANRALAEAELKRFRDLRTKGFVSESALDAKVTAFRAADAQAALARNQTTYTTLAADHDGVVTGIFAEAGQVVAAGQPVVRVARPGERELLVNVPEGQVEALRYAKSLSVQPWGQPEPALVGRLRELAPAADPATRTFAARITIVDAPASLQLGMTARVSFAAGGSDGLLVPAGAVVDQGQGPAVWVVANDRAVRRPVKVLRHREDGVLIASGLAAGETIVVVGAHRLLPDQAVKPVMQP